MGVGAGGMAHAAQVMKRISKDIERAGQRRIDAVFAVRKELKRRKLQPGTNSVTSFDCYDLCLTCGYLSDGLPDACPACKDRHFANLRDEEVALYIQKQEAEKRQRIPGAAWLVTGLSGILIIAILSAVTALLFDYFILGLVMGVLLLAPMYLALLRHVAKLLVRVGEQRPIRWRLPIPIPAGDAKPITLAGGKATGTPVRAPLTGRPALAYELKVLFDAHGDARPPEWVLEETTSVEMTVGDTRIPEGLALLHHAQTTISYSDDIPTDTAAAFKKFLRVRGLFFSDGQFKIHETILPPDTEVTVKILESSQVYQVEVLV